MRASCVCGHETVWDPGPGESPGDIWARHAHDCPVKNRPRLGGYHGTPRTVDVPLIRDPPARHRRFITPRKTRS